MKFFNCLFFFFLIVLPASSFAEGVQSDKNDVEKTYKMGDPELDTLWISEKNGEILPLDTQFFDEDNKPVTLAELIDKPTLILPIYFYCPSSCSLNLVNLATAIKRSNFKSGKDFKVIAFSFNELETYENARIAKRNYLRLLPDNFKKENWKFLTGPKESILAVTEAVGYKFLPQKDGTFIHPSALVATADDGMIIKYVYGSFIPGDVDLAILEAKRKTPAKSIRRLLGYCFNYDPQKNWSFFQNLKIAVLISFTVLGALFFLYIKRSNRKKTASNNENKHTG